MTEDLHLDGSLAVQTPGKGDLHQLLQEDPEIQALVNRANEMVAAGVSSNEELGAMTDLLSEIKEKNKALNDARVKEKKPSLTEGRRIDKKYKVPRNMLHKVIKLLNEASGKFVDELDAQADAAILEEDERVKRETEDALRIANANGTEPKLPTPKILPKAPKRIETGVSSTTFLKKKKILLPDVRQGQEATITRADIRVSAIPDEFFKVDMVKLKRAREAGEHIPGLEEIAEHGTMTR